ncbi:hypothetical protein Tco_1384335 [Tanacetum coccineum]
MKGPLLGQGFDDDGRTTPTTKELLKECLSALRSLVKEHNSCRDVSPIRLNIGEDKDDTKTRTIITGKEVGDDDLKRPFKETVKTLLTQRIIEFAVGKFWGMAHASLVSHVPADPIGKCKGWVECLPAGSIDEWSKL